MLNKMYEFLKENIKSILVIVIFVVVMNLNLPFSVYAPGGTIDISKRLNKDSKTSVNMTYVSFVEGKVPVLFLSLFLPNWDIVKNDDIKYDNEEMADSLKRDRISLYESISNAKSVAYKYVNKPLKIEKTTYYVTYISSSSDTDLRIGDELISIDGRDFTPDIVETYLNTLEEGAKVSIKVKNSDKEYTRFARLIKANDKTLIGVSYAKVNDYKDSLEYNYKKSESGPSGGAMLTLALIQELSGEAITDKKICGTGTIDIDGNIGEIGGVKYKMLGASKNKCDVFITPKENYKEAKKVKEKNKLKIELIEADNIEDLMEKLSS